MEIDIENPKEIFNIWTFVIAIALILIFIFGIIIIYEIKNAQNFCFESNGNYSLNIKQLQHYCNGEPLYKYSDGSWNYDMAINISELFG